MYLQKLISRKTLYKKIIFLLASWRSMTKKQNTDPHPDPLVRGMDPRIRIRFHPKMSWILNTASILAEPTPGTGTYCQGVRTGAACCAIWREACTSGPDLPVPVPVDPVQPHLPDQHTRLLTPGPGDDDISTPPPTSPLRSPFPFPFISHPHL
jgi:hypothetical protein